MALLCGVQGGVLRRRLDNNKNVLSAHLQADIHHCPRASQVRNIMMGHMDMKLWRSRVVMKLGVVKARQLFEGYPQGMLVTTPSGAEHTSVSGLGPQSSCAEVLRTVCTVQWAVRRVVHCPRGPDTH